MPTVARSFNSLEAEAEIYAYTEAYWDRQPVSDEDWDSAEFSGLWEPNPLDSEVPAEEEEFEPDASDRAFLLTLDAYDPIGDALSRMRRPLPVLEPSESEQLFLATADQLETLRQAAADLEDLDRWLAWYDSQQPDPISDADHLIATGCV